MLLGEAHTGYGAALGWRPPVSDWVWPDGACSPGVTEGKGNVGSRGLKKLVAFRGFQEPKYSSNFQNLRALGWSSKPNVFGKVANPGSTHHILPWYWRMSEGRSDRGDDCPYTEAVGEGNKSDSGSSVSHNEESDGGNGGLERAERVPAGENGGEDKSSGSDDGKDKIR